MKPVLYPSQETAFGSNGLGILTDAASCVITEERNGAFELEMTYPVSGIHYKEIAPRCIILAKPNPVDDLQPFRVYRITKPMGGLVTIYGEHISYDLAGVPASPFAAESAPDAMEKLKSSSAIPTPFSFWTDKDTAGTMGITAPVALRSLLGGREGSVLDVYGGEYKFDRYTVRLYNQRGQNRGASIRYGKNLTDLTQDENIAGVYTGVYPYWSSMEGALVQLPEKILLAPGNYDFTRIMTLDLSSEFQEPPTEDQLRVRAEAYIKANHIGVPKVSLTVSFVPLEQTEEYKDIGLLERVELCDTVNVEFPSLGVSATAKCVRTVYDALLDRYKSVELGDARTNIADTIAAQQQKIEQTPDKTFVQQAVDSATGQITGNKGGYVVLHSSTGSKEPDEILIMDTPDIKTAVKVWRWNKAGLGYSSHGYNGPYGLAMTQDGSIVADFITAGILTASIIKTGILQSANGASKINMDTGIAILTGSFESLRKNTTEGDVRSHIDSGGFWSQRASGQRRGVYTNTAGQIITNTDSVLVTVEKEESVWGRTAAFINATNDGCGAIGVNNKNGKRVAAISINYNNHPYMAIYSEDNKVLSQLYADSQGGAIDIRDISGINRIHGMISGLGIPLIRLSGKSGNRAVDIFESPENSSGMIILYDKNSAARVYVGTSSVSGTPFIQLRSSGGEIVAELAETSDGKGQLYLKGASGGGSGGSDFDNLSCNYLTAGLADVDALRVDGLGYAPETITDGSGQRWRVLAVAD